MSNMPAGLLATLLAVCFTAAAPTAHAFAQEAAYVGTWALDAKQYAKQCKLGQHQQGAPLLVKKNRLDQHEAHCEFGSVRASGMRWEVRANCTVEGNKERRNMVLSVKDARLTVAWGDGVTTTYRKC